MNCRGKERKHVLRETELLGNLTIARLKLSMFTALPLVKAPVFVSAVEVEAVPLPHGSQGKSSGRCFGEHSIVAPLTHANTAGFLSATLRYMSIYIGLGPVGYCWTQWDDNAVGSRLLQAEAAVAAVGG